MTSLGGPNWVTQTSWSGTRSEGYNSTKPCYFPARTELRVTSFGRGYDRTVRLNLGVSLGSGSALASERSFVRLFFFLPIFLAFFLFLSLSLSRGLTCRIRLLAFSRRLDDAPHTPPLPPLNPAV